MPNGPRRPTVTPAQLLIAPPVIAMPPEEPPLLIPQWDGNHEGHDAPVAIANAREPSLPPLPPPELPPPPPTQTERLERDWVTARYQHIWGDRPRIEPPPRWPSAPNWDLMRYSDSYVSLPLLAAAIAMVGYAHAAPATLEAFKTAIGADSIEPVGMTLPTPSGIKIEYPKTTIFAIAGTTELSQVAAYVTGERDSYCILGADGRPEIEFSGTKTFQDLLGVPFTTRRKREYFGCYFKPFVTWARDWIPTIMAAATACEASGKKLVVIGHSAGGAICEVIGNWASAWASAALSGTPGVTYGGAAKGRTLYNVWRGGYTFGQPRPACWDYPHVDVDVHGDKTYRGGNSNYQSSVKDSLLTKDIRCINHPKDPIGYLPMGVTPVQIALSAWRSARDYQHNTTLMDSEKFLATLPEDRTLTPLDFLSVSNLRDAFARVHSISNYYSRILRRLISAKWAGSAGVYADVSAILQEFDVTAALKFPWGAEV